jgi:tight adherence protein B
MMSAGLLLPVLTLFGVLLASIAVLRADVRRQQLRERVHALSALGGSSDLAVEMRQSIRLSQRRGARIVGFLSRMFGMLTELKMAQIIPTWMVFLLGLVAAVGDAMIGRLYFSLPISALGGFVTGLFVMRALFRWQFVRYVTKLRRQLPDAIELLVSTISAGLPVSEGFRAVAREMPEPTKEEFTRIVEEVALGASVDAALRALHHRTRVAEYAILAVTLAVQSRSGGRLAETMSTLADTVRQRMAIVARAGALAGEAKLSAVILGVLPIVAGVAMSLSQPDFLAPLFYEERGQRLLFIGIVTLTMGAVTMRQMIRGAVRE